MSKTILLTGGTGFLGGHILNKLVKLDYHIIVLVRKTSNQNVIRLISEKITVFIIDDDKSNLKDLFRNYSIEIIIHTATDYGRNSSLANVLETNVILPIKLIEEGLNSKLEHFINTDTFFAKDQYIDCSYMNHYVKSKRILKEFLVGLSKKVNVSNLRLEHVFGENDSKQKFVTTLFKQLLENKEDIYLTKGIQTRDFIYVEDVVQAFISVLKHTNVLEGYNEFEVGLGNSIRVREFVEKVSAASNSSSKLWFGKVPIQDGEIMHSIADIGALSKIGWKPRYSIDLAIRKIINEERNKRK